MAVYGNLRGGKRDLLFPAGLPDDIARSPAGSHVYRDAALQVGKVESVLSVAAVSCADQLEQHIVFGNGQLRSIAKRPARGRKVASKHPYFTYVRCSHAGFVSSKFSKLV